MIEQLESQILEDAVEVLDERGWCRNNLVEYDGRVCLVGAIYQAAGYISIDEYVYDGVSRHDWVLEDSSREKCAGKARYAVTEHLTESAEQWNDLSATSKEEVQEVLMTVAKKLRNEGR